MASRSYSSGDRTALIALSGGSCMWPDCNEPIVKRVDDEYVVAAQIAHIYGLEPGSARHDEEMTDAERNAFTNLLFLCFPHHRTVDRHPAQYPASLLHDWKGAREAAGIGVLGGLSGLTEGRLEEMIQAAHQEQGEVVQSTLERLERQGDDAADVIRELLAELTQLRHRSAFPDEDTVALLTRSSDRLAHLQDSAVAANRAADRLVGLGDVTTSLWNAARQLASLNLSDTTARLDQVVERLRRVQGGM